MEPKCRPRKCLETGSVWDPVTCQCSESEEGCEDGEQLYIDVFGQGVCGCRSVGLTYRVSISHVSIIETPCILFPAVVQCR